MTKRSDPGELKEEVPKRLCIVTKHSRPLWMATDTVSEQPEKRARFPEDHAEVNPETFVMTLESRGTMETYTELNVVASDLHESDPEEMWSNDLGWVPKSDLQAARDKEVTKLQEFDTFEEVPQDEAEGDIISSRFVDKWETSGELRSRLVSRGCEASQIDPASLFAATPSVTATRIALVLGLAHDVDIAVADISGAFLHEVVEQPFHVKPPIEYRKTGIVWKVKRYLYSDKRAPRVWQDHFETTLLNLNFERLESEPGCFVKKGATLQDSIIVVVRVDDLLSGKTAEARQILHAAGGKVEDQTHRVLGGWQACAVPGRLHHKVQGQNNLQ